MNFKNVAIIGVGLIGSSFALSLKKHGFNGRITGVGKKEENLVRAKELGIIDGYSIIPLEGIKDADLILLATPVGQFEKIAENIKQGVKTGAVVTDVGSVKAEVVKKLESLMPEGVSFVGGHPIAGKECSGIDAATSELFKDARCILTPTSNTNKEALERIIELWKVFGSRISLMTPEEHDLIFAAVSHLPHVVAYVLVNTIMDVKTEHPPNYRRAGRAPSKLPAGRQSAEDRLKKNTLHHGGRGLKDMTRIALSPTELWRDICSYNRENMLKALQSFSSSVSHITELIERSDWTGLEKEFIKAKEARQLLESD